MLGISFTPNMLVVDHAGVKSGMEVKLQVSRRIIPWVGGTCSRLRIYFGGLEFPIEVVSTASKRTRRQAAWIPAHGDLTYLRAVENSNAIGAQSLASQTFLFDAELRPPGPRLLEPSVQYLARTGARRCRRLA